ncbi:PREDICTED: splicing factor U2af large subunit A-like isoform X2 [Populus euphratica]|uniref:Splicing factor U2af large subunit n=1 Tax=Populus euphratica TaxID=75702 RepID=A0AAJ6TNL5_POPEU|nr:PREDICTED: splicing factor U2af large subunit A-like isoform X2 [Populus euphratica]
MKMAMITLIASPVTGSRESEHDRSRTRGREKDHDRYRRGSKDGSVRDDRRREKMGDFDRHERSSRDRNYHRHRDYDGDRDRRNGNRSSSHSQGRFQNRSRSRSPSKSKRKSGFDMAPSMVGIPPGAAVTGPHLVSASCIHRFFHSINDAGQLPSVPQTMPGMIQNTLQFGTTQFGVLPLMPAHTMTQQATRHARRVYVGGLPPLANEQTIATFFSHVMTSIGGNAAGPGDAVVNVYINHEKKFAFVEMRTVEEASNAMTLDGIIFEGVAVRVRRPTDYNPSLAATLGPSQPSPLLNLAAVGLVPGTISGAEGPDRVFVGGLPYYFTESQIRELLESFGPLRGFDLVKDRDTGNTKGYGFCVYQDPAVTDIACAALNGLKMGDKTLTVRRGTESGGQSRSEQENILAQAQQHIAIQKMALQAGVMNLPGVGIPLAESSHSPSKVLCLTEAIAMEVLADDVEYEEILEDMREECCKFGTLINVVIPRPSQTEEQISGAGKVFLEYSDTSSCSNARSALNGRKFGGNTVNASYYPEDKYHNGDYGF